MSHYAGAVQIVTTAGSAGRRGLTLTAACSVSDNPPTILICLQKIHEETSCSLKTVFLLSIRLQARISSLQTRFRAVSA